MISPNEREKLKSKEGSYYINAVSSKLLERGILNRKNEPYGQATISQVANGHRSNAAIEDVIRTMLKENLSETKNPEARTSGFE